MAGQTFIAKVYRQHASLVVAVPKPVCIALGMKQGDYAVFTWHQVEGRFAFEKFIPAGEKEDESKRNPDKKN